jgi:radical SAM protein with 4Fe4S-binding SPASM domain
MDKLLKSTNERIKGLIKDFLLKSSIYDFIYMLKIKKAIKSKVKGPTVVRIESTNLCNMHCIMCPRDELTREKKVMNQDIYEKIIKDCITLSVPKVLFSGFGEPLFDKDIVKKIYYAKKMGIREIHMFTNASLMDEHMASELIYSGLDYMIISLDAANAEDYQKIKPGINFDCICKNIISFLRLRRTIYRNKPYVKIRLTKLNGDKGNGVIIKKFKKLKAEIVYPALHDWSGQLKSSIACQNNLMQIPSWPCYLLWTSLTILCDGSVPLCCKDFNKVFNFGNIKEKSLAEIWENEYLEAIRRKHLKRSFNEINLCRACELTQAPRVWWEI